MPRAGKDNRYSRIIEKVFLGNYRPGADRVPFTRADLESAASELGVRLPKNLGDLIYSFRFRTAFPPSILRRAPKGRNWIIRLVGRSRYCFVANAWAVVSPRPGLASIKIPDATPGIIEKYAWTDEQALLAKVRYNRLVDVFTGVACYSLQSHLRTSVTGVGQVETDEVYVGVDRRGAQYAFPVQAKRGRDRLGVTQVEQDFAVCHEKFPFLICRPIGAQFISHNAIALFEFQQQGDQIVVSCEKHYCLVPQEDVAPEDLDLYGRSPLDA